MVEFVAEAEWPAELGDFAREVGEQASRIGFAERCRHCTDEHRCRAEALNLETHVAELPRGSFEAIAVRFFELDDLGNEKRLASNSAAISRSPHPLKH